MNSRWKWIYQAAGPAGVMLLLGFAILKSRRAPAPVPDAPAPATNPASPAAPSTPAAPPASDPAAPPASDPAAPPASDPAAVDFSTLSPGGTVPDWNTSQGNFRLVTLEDRTVMELSHEPMVEGRLVWNRIFKNQGTVRARMWGEKTRRTSPRFALGVTSSTLTYWFRAIPAEKSLQWVSGAGEAVLASTPWQGDPTRPLWLEMSVGPLGNGGSRLEGRVWAEGQARSEAASLTLEIPGELGFARAVVAAAPYALKPVFFDRLEASSP